MEHELAWFYERRSVCEARLSGSLISGSGAVLHVRGAYACWCVQSIQRHFALGSGVFPKSRFWR